MLIKDFLAQRSRNHRERKKTEGSSRLGKKGRTIPSSFYTNFVPPCKPTNEVGLRANLNWSGYYHNKCAHNLPPFTQPTERKNVNVGLWSNLNWSGYYHNKCAHKLPPFTQPTRCKTAGICRKCKKHKSGRDDQYQKPTEISQVALCVIRLFSRKLAT